MPLKISERRKLARIKRKLNMHAIRQDMQKETPQKEEVVKDVKRSNADND